MKPLLHLLITVSVLCPTLAFAQTIYKRQDKFEGTTEYYTWDQQAKLEGGSFFSLRYVDFSLHAVSNLADQSKPYLLMVKTTTPQWVFIPSGASLALKLDGSTILKLSGPGSIQSRRVLDANSLLEIASYQVSAADLQQIGQAKVVEFRIYGERQDITGNIPPKFLGDAAMFAQKVPELLGQSPAPSSSAEVAASNTPASPSPIPAATSGKPVRFGVVFADVTSFIAGGPKPPDKSGVSVITVEAHSVAENAGVKKNDVIRDFNGTTIHQRTDLISAIAQTSPGQTVPITIWRDGNESTIEVQF